MYYSTDVKDIKDIERTLNEDLHCLTVWLKECGLKLNTNKTKFTLLCTKHIIKQINTQKIAPNIFINDVKIEQVASIKHLGVMLDPGLY